MNIQEAYNKGLTDAEDAIHKAYSDALISIDSGPLQNPKMEQLRRDIMDRNIPVSENVSKSGIIEDIILGKPVQIDENDAAMVTFKQLMDHFIMVAKNKKSNVGKAFAKILNEKRSLLTSD